MKRPVALALLLIAAAVLLVAALPGNTIAEDIQSVFITNFPKVFPIQGTVGIDGPVKQAKAATLREIVVPPVSPKETTRLIQGGNVESDGFANMVLSLQGSIKGEVYRSGTVGVYLLPDEENVVKVFDEKGLMQFQLEVAASGVSGASPYFSSPQGRAMIAFPRYRTYFYNTTDKTVTVTLYTYMTN